MTRALLAGCDLALLESYKDHLEQRGVWVLQTDTEQSTIREILAGKPDLVVIEGSSPGMDPLEVCRRVRSYYSGIILLLGSSADEGRQITGLSLGADDYLVKPVSPRLLWARICVLTRRNGHVHPSHAEGIRLKAGPIVLMTTTATAYLSGRELRLTQGEYDLLHILVRNAGRAVDRDTLHRKLRGAEWDGLDRSVDQRVKRLRKKLGDSGRHPRLIKSARGCGYVLCVPEVAPESAPK